MLHKRSSQPRSLVGFESVTRYWDAQREVWAAKIGPGEFYVTLKSELIVTVLGSCVSACVRDPVSQVAGMNHFMLPGSLETPTTKSDQSHNRYGCFAMENLLNTILKHGGERSRLELKIFGGGRVLTGVSNVGARNIEFVRAFVKSEGLRLLSEDLGGDHPRKIYFSPEDGKVRLKRLRHLRNRTLEMREATYARDLEKTSVVGEIELFD